MKIGMMNNPTEKDVIKEIEWAGKNNFDFIDLTLEFPSTYPNFNTNAVKKTLKKYNMGLVGHTDWAAPISSVIKEVRQGAVEYFYNCLEIFSKLNSSMMNLHVDHLRRSFLQKEIVNNHIKSLKSITEKAKEHDIKVMLEHFAPARLSLSDLKKIFKNVPLLKFHLDVGHANLKVKENFTKTYLKHFRKKLLHIHFSDNKGVEDEHLPLGCGNINWPEIIKLLKKYNYNSTITLEIFSQDRDYLLMSRDKVRKWWEK